MAKELYSFTSADGPDPRGLSHTKLEEVLASGQYPNAECREDSTNGIYSVWDGPQSRLTTAPTVETIDLSTASKEQLDVLAEMIAAKLRKG